MSDSHQGGLVGHRKDNKRIKCARSAHADSSLYIYIYIYPGNGSRGPRKSANFLRAIFFFRHFVPLGFFVLVPRSMSLGTSLGVKLQVPGVPNRLHFDCQGRLGMQHMHRGLAKCSQTGLFGSKFAMQTTFFRGRWPLRACKHRFTLRYEDVQIPCILQGF